MQNLLERIQEYAPFFGEWYLGNPPNLLGKGNSGFVYQIWKDTPDGRLDAAMKVISIPRDDKQMRLWWEKGGKTDEGLRSRIQLEYEYVRAEIATMETLKADSHIVCFESWSEHRRKDIPFGYDILIRMERLVNLVDFLKGVSKGLYPHAIGMNLYLRIWDDLLCGLSLCERNHVLHLDIKPDNIFYAEPSKDYFKLGDFGVSIRNKSSQTAGQGLRVGTPEYMSPEIYNFKGGDSRSDMYSLAIVIYEKINGRIPFLKISNTNDKLEYQKAVLAAVEKRNVEKVPVPPIAGVDPRLMAIILKCLAYDAKDRYENVQEMQTALRAYIFNPPPPPPPPQDGWRRWLKPVLFGTAALVVVGGAIRLLTLRRPTTVNNNGTIQTEWVETQPSEEIPPVISVEQETPLPVAESIEFTEPRAISEDDGQFTVRSDASVYVEVYCYHSESESMNVALRDPAHIVGRGNADQNGIVVYTNNPHKGDVYVIQYQNSLDETQEHRLTVEPSKRSAIEFEIENMIQRQDHPVVRGSALRIVNGHAEADKKVYLYWVPGDGEPDINEDIPYEPTVRTNGIFRFELPADGLNIDETGQMGTLWAVYDDGLGYSSWKSEKVLWTLDESTSLEFEPAMVGDAGIELRAEPGAVLTARRVQDNAMFGPVQVPPEGAAELQTGEALKAGETYAIHAEDAVGNVADVSVMVSDYAISVDNFARAEQRVIEADTVRLSGSARPDGEAVIAFVDMDGHRYAIQKPVTVSQEGTFEAELAAEALGMPFKNVRGSFVIVRADGSELQTEAVDWRMEPPIVPEYPDMVAEDEGEWHLSANAPVDMEVFFFQKGEERTLDDAHRVFSNRVDEAGVQIPTNAPREGDSYVVRYTDTLGEAQTIPIEVVSSKRQAIQFNIGNAVRAEGWDRPVVRGGALKVVNGQADPDSAVSIYWLSEGEEPDPSEAPLETLSADADGRFETTLSAEQVGIDNAGRIGSIAVIYDDGLARSCWRTEAVVWTLDDETELEYRPAMSGDAGIELRAEHGATLTIQGRKKYDPVEVTAGDYFLWEPDEKLAEGDSYAIRAVDKMGNAREVSVTVGGYALNIDNLSDGEVKGDTARLTGRARPNTEINVRFLPEGGRAVECGSVTVQEDGSYEVPVSANDLGLDGERLRGHFALSSDDGWQDQTDDFDWMRVVSLEIQGDLNEDSAALTIRTEPGARVSISRDGESVVTDVPVNASGSYAFGNSGDPFIVGERYEITASDPESPERTSQYEVTVAEAPRAKITADVVPDEAMPVVAGLTLVKGELIIRGTAQPNADVHATWREGGDIPQTVYMDGDGSYTIEIAPNDMADGRTPHAIVVAYADGRAASQNATTRSFYWTDDFTLDELSVEPLVAGETELVVHTESYATVKVEFPNGEGEIRAADGKGELRLPVEPFVEGEVYIVSAVDRFGNRYPDVLQMQVGLFDIGVENVSNGLIRGDTAAIFGTAKPNTSLTLTVQIDGANERVFENWRQTDGQGLYRGTISEEEIQASGLAVDGRRARFLVNYGMEQSAETPEYRWNVKLPLAVDGSLDEDSKTLSGVTEPGAILTIAYSGDEGGSGSWQKVSEARASDDGRFSYTPAEGFRSGSVYRVTAQDPNDSSRRSETTPLRVDEVARAQIKIVQTDQRKDAKGRAVVTGKMLRIEGRAEPGTRVTASWSRSGVREVTVPVSNSGVFTVELNGAIINAAGQSGYVALRYADGKAASKGSMTNELLWTSDDSVRLTIDPVMEGENVIRVHTDPNATVEFSIGSAKIPPRTADSVGNCSYDFGNPLRAGQSITVLATDEFNNTSTVMEKVQADDFAAIQIELTGDAIVNAATQALQATIQAQPDTELVFYVDGVAAGGALALYEGVSSAELAHYLNVDAVGIVRTGIDGKVYWRADIQSLDLPEEGNIVLSCKYREGHVNRASKKLTVKVDRVPPKLEVDLSNVSEKTTAIDGQTELGAQVELSVDGARRSVTAYYGDFTFSGLSLANGQQVSVSSMDAAGNSSEVQSTTVGEREGGGIGGEVSGQALKVSGWVILMPGDEYNLSYRIDGSDTGVSVKVTEMSPEEMRHVKGAVNEAGKKGYRIEQDIDIGKLTGGSHKLELWINDWNNERMLDSFDFQTTGSAIRRIEPEYGIDPDGRFAFGLDELKPMRSSGIMLTGWFYGAESNYIVSEAQLVQIYDDNEEVAPSAVVSEALDINGMAKQGSLKLTRNAVELPQSVRSRLTSASFAPTNAGFIVWIDSWNVPDGDYKVILVLNNGGKKYRVSAQLSISGSAPSVASSDIQRIANTWNPVSVLTPAQ